tara:strand:- start:18270 stop:19121 length:852 start_codon:yes stop_codon:yes gene_type:complete
VKTIVFISDMFIEQYAGGAELTTEALITKASKNYSIVKLNSQAADMEKLEQLKKFKFIVCNFSALSQKSKLYMCKNLNYDLIEYDYKFCEYRSLEKHKAATLSPCDCLERLSGKVNAAFYGYAKKIWFMSKAQQQIFLKNVKTIKSEKCEVLSSVFSDGDLRFMDSIKSNEKNNKYLILNSGSWIKGSTHSIEFAEKNNLEYEMVQGLSYHDMLIKLSTSKGLIFRPLGGDTCPRIVIEALLLGCDLKLNDFVQHKDEDWFKNQEKCYEYMRTRSSHFWEHYE